MDETMKVIAAAFLFISVSMLIFGGVYILQGEHDAAAESIEWNNLTTGDDMEAANQGVVATMTLASAIPIFLFLLLIIGLAGMLYFSIR
jgi:hypothetical protein